MKPSVWRWWGILPRILANLKRCVYCCCCELWASWRLHHQCFQCCGRTVFRNFAFGPLYWSRSFCTSGGCLLTCQHVDNPFLNKFARPRLDHSFTLLYTACSMQLQTLTRTNCLRETSVQMLIEKHPPHPPIHPPTSVKCICLTLLAKRNTLCAPTVSWWDASSHVIEIQSKLAGW